ncbi:MAG: site-specific integrase, partial [Gallionella sp.]|nr:site-specific integrase [Gallionella sp.]
IKGARDKALLLMGFAGAFRRSELVSITVEDVSFVDQGMIVHLKRGKTDQAGKGRDVAIPYMRGMCCPVKAIQEWLAISEISSGAVFRRIDRHGNLLEQRLSPQSVALLVKQRIMAIGKDDRLYSGHSLRAGWVTNAALSGASAWKICQHTGHQSEAVMQRYIRSGNMFMNYPLLRN